MTIPFPCQSVSWAVSFQRTRVEVSFRFLCHVVSQSLECVSRYYTTNPDRFRKRIRVDNTFDDESWVSRASLRQIEDLNQAIRNELESMDLWDDGEGGRVAEAEDSEIEELVGKVRAVNEKVAEVEQIRKELRKAFQSCRPQLLEELQNSSSVSRLCVCFEQLWWFMD